jgi:hypothetical protein
MQASQVCNILLMAVLAGSIQAKEAGIFYSTLYAKTMEPERLSDFAGDATAWFLADVNGDTYADAVAYFGKGTQAGQWWAAHSDGEKFGSPSLYLKLSKPRAEHVALMGDIDGDGMADACHFEPSSGRWFVCISQKDVFLQPKLFGRSQLKDANLQFLADINGDGKADAVVAKTNAGSGEWLAGFSTSTEFSEFATILDSFGQGADQWFMGDVNGDGMADAISYIKRNGLWTVALATGHGFQRAERWRLNFGDNAEFGFVDDIDADGKCDIGHHTQDDWYVSYSNGKQFGDYSHRWIADLGLRKERSARKQNPPPPVAWLTGAIGGKHAWACLVDEFGRWFAVKMPKRNRTLVLTTENTYVAWRCSYLPQIPGHEGTYDSGDPDVHDAQIQMMHDAGFTYVMLDITNGYHAWVDDRARNLMKRIRHWNNNLKPGQHKMYVNISLGRTRDVAPKQAFFEKLNLECKRAWEEFYFPFKDCYYMLNGKPLVIHMISNGLKEGWYKELDTWNGGDRTYIDKVTNRWMTGWGGCTSKRANFYGWDVRDKFGNPIHQEMMPVMPGFWNAGNFVHREGGNYYRSHWMRVIKHQPDSVWINSLNETWEHTSVEPAYMFNTREPHPGITMWTDAHGERMDDYYWVMTRQYMKLYMEGNLIENTYFQEFNGDTTAKNFGPIYKATQDGFEKQSTPPRQAPILLMPQGFRDSFHGKVVRQ